MPGSDAGPRATKVRGRQLLVDGSLIDNLPVETMAVTGEGPVLAVDVKPSFEPPTTAGGGGGQERERDGPGSEGRPPSLMETMTRVLLLASANTSQAARDHADLVIRPAGGGVGLLEFHQIDRMREEGRRAALEALEAADERLFA